MDDDIEFGYCVGDWASLYALDAISPSERLLIERWLDEGDSDRRNDFSSEVAAVRSTMDVLAELTAVDPPPRLRRRVVARVSRHRYSIRYSGESAQPIRRDLSKKIGAMVAVAIVFVGGVAGAVVFDRESAIPGLGQIVAVSDARTMHTDVVGGGTIVTTVSDLPRSVTVEARGLEDVARGGSEFQLWLVSTAGPSTVDAGRLDDRRVITGIEGVDALMVTVEPAGGSKQPTQRPVAVIWLA
ncbi:anti-sigma factor [Rhodococcus erythropolis]|uniref:anti-sigma factor n=1 Tax=Rhodococcus erythropolis TaxID=1833 RepID=UPI00294A8714|nr:anti-sigma factor [Rhodococcus erythropolis]MDV6278296.1 anti-sigma factor [Rhodococcus erythropolis]